VGPNDNKGEEWDTNFFRMQVAVKAGAGDYAIEFGGVRNPISFQATDVFKMTSKDGKAADGGNLIA